MFQFRLRKINQSAVSLSGESDVHSQLIRNSAVDTALLDGTEVAGLRMYFFVPASC